MAAAELPTRNIGATVRRRAGSGACTTVGGSARTGPRLNRGIAALGLWAVALAAASCLPRTSPAPDPALDQTWVYSCQNEYRFSARILSDLVSLRLPTRTTALPRVVARTGTRYAAQGVELTRTGETATLQIGDETHAGCSGQRAESGWDEARMLGADFRAAGREPTWSLEIDTGRQMRFLIEGSSEIITPVAEPVRTDSTTSYRAAAGGHEIDVTIQERACPDSRLGAGLTHTVKLAVDGFPYLGCGRMLGGLPAGS